MNRKNEALKNSNCTEFWKQSSTTQHILLSALDLDRGKFQLEFLKVRVPFPRSVDNYKNSMFSFDTKQIYPIYQIDLHKQVGEKLYYILNNIHS